MKKIAAQMKISNQQSGFTLIEILVVTVILGLMIAVVSNVFVTLLRNQNKTNILAEVRSNAALVIDAFERDVRSAVMIETVCSGSGCTYSDYSTLTGVPSAIQTSPMTGNFGLVLTYRDSETKVYWQCLTEDDFYSGAENGRFLRGTNSTDAAAITNTDPEHGVSVVDCSFTSDDPADPNSARLVSLQFVAREGAITNDRFSGNSELTVDESTFQTTVGIRAF